jgi:hypothetical protein
MSFSTLSIEIQPGDERAGRDRHLPSSVLFCSHITISIGLSPTPIFTLTCEYHMENLHAEAAMVDASLLPSTLIPLHNKLEHYSYITLF